MQNKKTYKRELAIFMLSILLGCYLLGILGNPAALVVAEQLKTPVFILVSGAFGLDAVIKSIK